MFVALLGAKTPAPRPSQLASCNTLATHSSSQVCLAVLSLRCAILRQLGGRAGPRVQSLIIKRWRARLLAALAWTMTMARRLSALLPPTRRPTRRQHCARRITDLPTQQPENPVAEAEIRYDPDKAQKLLTRQPRRWLTRNAQLFSSWQDSSCPSSVTEP